MKRVSILFLIIAFLFYINCTSYFHRVNFDNAYISCKAIFVDGTVDIDEEQRGILIASDESIRFEYEGGDIDIPFSSLINIESDEKLENVLPRIPKPNAKSYSKEKTSPSFGDALLFIGIIWAVALAVYLITKLSKKQDYITFNFTINGQNEWSTFKAKAGDIHKIIRIQSENTVK